VLFYAEKTMPLKLYMFTNQLLMV